MCVYVYHDIFKRVILSRLACCWLHPFCMSSLSFSLPYQDTHLPSIWPPSSAVNKTFQEKSEMMMISNNFFLLDECAQLLLLSFLFCYQNNHFVLFLCCNDDERDRLVWIFTISPFGKIIQLFRLSTHNWKGCAWIATHSCPCLKQRVCGQKRWTFTNKMTNKNFTCFEF